MITQIKMAGRKKKFRNIFGFAGMHLTSVCIWKKMVTGMLIREANTVRVLIFA
jgi:hypothetical protein